MAESEQKRTDESRENPADLPKRKPARWEKAFLRVLALNGNVSEAVREAKIGRTVVYDLRNSAPDFKKLWDDALEAACDSLEREAIRRARDGVDEPVIYQGELCGVWVDENGNQVRKDEPGARFIPLTVKKYSDALMALLLKAHRPEKYRERSSVEHSGSVGTPITVIEVVRPPSAEPPEPESVPDDV